MAGSDMGMLEIKTREAVFTAFFPFCGLGAGALGFLNARVTLLNRPARFISLGGIDISQEACDDFEKITGSPALCADMHNLDEKQIRTFVGHRAPDVVFSSPPCLPADGPVVTEQGPRPISELRPGDRVLAHTGAMREVRRIGTELYKGRMYGVRLNGTVDVQRFTAEHPVWRRRVVRRKGKRQLGDPEFVPASELRVGDRVGFPRGGGYMGTAQSFVSKIAAECTIRGRSKDLSSLAGRPSLWLLIGAYLGAGYRRASRHEVIFCVGHAGGEKAELVRDCLADLGLKMYEDWHAGRSNIKIRVHAIHLCAIMGRFGDGASRKDIPAELMNLQTDLIDKLIEGYRATDGSSQGRRMANNELQARWRIASTSLPLLRSVQRLLLRRGIFGSINHAGPSGKQTILGREVNTLPRWEICVRKSPKKRTVFEFTAAHVWTRIREITVEDVEEDVWNLEVDTDNTFCAPMMATHNCKGFSALLSKKLAGQEKYQKLNRLVIKWVELMVSAWPDNPPRLIIMENVPGITSRGKKFLEQVHTILESVGYHIHEGFHDCGEIGGLAQHRRRFLLVARLPRRCSSFLYKPQHLRVRGCGEVLEKLPVPGTPDAEYFGKLHQLPKISWLNWVRLSLIPAGGDWRDLPGSGAACVEDLRPTDYHSGVLGVREWEEPAGAVTERSGPSNGEFSVADPRLTCEPQGDAHGVNRWDDPAPTVTGGRLDNSKVSVADIRVKTAFDHGYKVLRWTDPSFTVAGQVACGTGAYQLADPRGDRAIGRRIAFEELLSCWDGDPKKAPPFAPVIICPDGCWHRPMTTLELAALQSLPTEIAGRPLELAGGAVGRWRERIGNAVPVQTAEAVATKMLIALLETELYGTKPIRHGEERWVHGLFDGGVLWHG